MYVSESRFRQEFNCAFILLARKSAKNHTLKQFVINSHYFFTSQFQK